MHPQIWTLASRLAVAEDVRTLHAHGYGSDVVNNEALHNKALRRASAYPTPEYRSRARALQREVKARVKEFRNESWSDLMEEIRPSHKAFWKITKALKTCHVGSTS
ncbi:hypothetical protein EVAR_15942_1 [Eumeta japonica]|uniref:Uncharacterized protein n=1 Tax=Eumeta variegata TaxID=151549 RepID=A0A4C1ULG8_EUMVA|nr:hypothetical protein EVAR_15942_1 [Eumeta japonica]